MKTARRSRSCEGAARVNECQACRRRKCAIDHSLQAETPEQRYFTYDDQDLVYTSDYAGRLVSYGEKTYTYDASGRTSSSASGSTTRYIDMSGQTVGERNATSGVANDYVFGPGIDEPLGKRAANGSITYFGADGLGSIVVATDSIGSILRSNSYSPWGETASVPPELFGYTGRETGGPSWYYHARRYDASHGRFLSEDPLRSAGNNYTYVNNDPADASDPSGLVIRRCYRMFSSVTNKVLGGLALASVGGVVQPPVPGTRWCPMHEYLYNTDTGMSQGYDPKENVRESGKNICYDIKEPMGTCVCDNFA
jgi:RHS repeat-associated protein